MRTEHSDRSVVKQSRFPVSLFGIFLLTLLLMSGIHTGLVVGMNKWGLNEIIQTVVPMLYWSAVAAVLTLYTAWQIRRTYEDPMKKLAKATSEVAQGDFSVYIPPIHTPEKLDYLDVMIVDFNKMVEELGSIETLKTDFFSNVSHEIKTPLAVIQNNAELLQKKNLTKEQQSECTETILYATKRLSSLITNMLKLNKLEKQTITPVPQKYDLCAQLCECALQFEHVWEEKGIELEADLEEHAVIEGDEELLALVWTNLLSNAIKFTPPGGTITISQSSDEKKITVSVAYEYKDVIVDAEQISMYLDCYENFGWVVDERNYPQEHSDIAGIHHQTTLHLKRDRKIINKMELTRLQRHFEACINEIKTLESSKTQMATVWALVVAVVGTAFMAGSTFAVVHEPPIIWLCILLAIPGFIGWILPWFLYQRIRKKQTEKLQPLIEAKQEEIYEICEKGHSLL